MSGGKLFHALGPATQNAQLLRHCLVRGTTRSPWAAEQRAAIICAIISTYMIAVIQNLNGSIASVDSVIVLC